jgi:hypothetical protein
VTSVIQFSRECHEFLKIPPTSLSQEYQSAGYREGHVALTRPEKFFPRGPYFVTPDYLFIQPKGPRAVTEQHGNRIEFMSMEPRRLRLLAFVSQSP